MVAIRKRMGAVLTESLQVSNHALTWQSYNRKMRAVEQCETGSRAEKEEKFCGWSCEQALINGDAMWLRSRPRGASADRQRQTDGGKISI